MSRRLTPLKCNHLHHCQQCRTELGNLEAMVDELLCETQYDEKPTEGQIPMALGSPLREKSDTHLIHTIANISLRDASSQLPRPRKA